MPFKIETLTTRSEAPARSARAPPKISLITCVATQNEISRTLCLAGSMSQKLVIAAKFIANQQGTASEGEWLLLLFSSD